jgi:hypothetical protein
MYELVSAIAKPLTGDGRWQAVDIGAVGMGALYATYARIVATLTNPFLPDLVALDFEDIRAQAGGLTKTFNQFLIDNAGAALPTSATLPVLDPKWALYNDAFKAGYKVTAIHPTASDGSGYPAAELTHLRLAKAGVDYTKFVKNCLVSVNGFYHPIDANARGVVVKWGNASAQSSGLNTIGIVSFRELGEVRQIPITPEMVYRQADTTDFKNRAYVNVGEDVSNKTLMLVLGGYLHVLDHQSFFRVNDRCVCVDFNNIPLFERIYESRRYINLASLDLAVSSRNPNLIAVSELLSDEVLTKYLTLPQSFFVVMDKTDIFVERQALRKTKMPDVFVSHVPPVWPVVVGHGKHTNFFASYEDQQWSINCRDTLRQNYLFKTTDARALLNISNARVPMKPVEHSQAFFLKVGTQLATTTMTRQAYLDNLAP